MELDTNTYDIGYIEMNPVVQEEIVADYTSWIDTWVDDTQSVAQRIWDEYVADESLLDEDAYEILDELVYTALEVVSQ